MFMVFKKKQMIIGTLVVMLGVAGYLNYRYDTGPDSDKKKNKSKYRCGTGHRRNGNGIRKQCERV